MSRGDWVPIRGYGSVTTLTPGVGSNQVDYILVRHGSETDPTDSTASIVEHAEAILTQRVIGQVRLVANGDVQYVMRIRTGIYDDATDTAAFYADSGTLFTSPSAEEPFLWQRYGVLQDGQDSLSAILHPWWSSMDVRVARRLERDTALFFSVAAALVAGTSMSVVPYLRTFARSLQA